MSNMIKEKWEKEALNHVGVVSLLTAYPKLNINDINIQENGSIKHVDGYTIAGYETISFETWKKQNEKQKLEFENQNNKMTTYIDQVVGDLVANVDRRWGFHFPYIDMTNEINAAIKNELNKYLDLNYYYEVYFESNDSTDDWSFYIKSDHPINGIVMAKEILHERYPNEPDIKHYGTENIASVMEVSREEYYENSSAAEDVIYSREIMIQDCIQYEMDYYAGSDEENVNETLKAFINLIDSPYLLQYVNDGSYQSERHRKLYTGVVETYFNNISGDDLLKQHRERFDLKYGPDHHKYKKK